MVWLAIAAVGTVALGLFLYWALIVTEGAYLGRRVVTLLYDLTADHYDRIKAITWQQDREWLVEPLLRRLQNVQRPLVLDVGTGSGRFPAALLADPRFDGEVWGVDLSRRMLQLARSRLAPHGPRCKLMRYDASDLPFADDTFDAVVCLEVIEFTPRPRRTLSEMVRVLQPGGTLLFSNRIAWRRWFPGRTWDDDRLFDLLGELPLRKAQIHNWNSFYDLVWAEKRSG